MEQYFLNSYKSFECIASRCPDSCCKDWDVVVDDEASKYYESLQGNFADKIRSVTEIDDDGDRIFVLKNGQCPFWNTKGLCDIYINLGEEHLCKTCKKFPRISLEYENFTEHMLSLACPEAARLMLSTLWQTDTVAKQSDDELFDFLLKSRAKTLEILADNRSDFSTKLKNILIFSNNIQKMLDCEYFDFSSVTSAELELGNINKNDVQFIFELHNRLDIMDKDFKLLMLKSSKKNHISESHPEYDREFESLAFYYIYRYYLNYGLDYDVLSPAKLIFCAYTVIGRMIESKFDFEDRVRIFQRYSKEVEHSYENNELMTAEFFTNPDFSTENLLSIL